MGASKPLILVSCFVLLLLFLPTYAGAANFFETGKALTIVNDPSIYREKLGASGWQLSAFSPGPISKTVALNGRLFVLGADGGLYVSDDGLSFNPLGLPKITNATIVSLASAVDLIGLSDGQTVSYAITSDLTIAQLLNTPSNLITNPDNIVDLNGQTYFSPDGAIFHLIGSTWQVSGSAPCLNFTLASYPGIELICSDQVYQWDDLGNPQALFPEAVEGVVSGHIIAAISESQPNLIYVYDGKRVASVNVVLPAPPKLVVIGQRLFLRNDKLYELDWSSSSPAALITANDDPDTVLVEERNSHSLYLISPVATYYSRELANYQLTVGLSAPFNSASDLYGNHMVWQANSSSTFSSDSSLVFHPITTSWASSSKIIDITPYNNVAYALITNSSGSLNLYITSDYVKWSRLSLPTQPTFTGSLASIRALPVNSLVEITGVLATNPGDVSSSLVYLEDQTGGLQVYLSSSKGVLPSAVGRWVVVNGTISSSGSKRVLLSALSGLELLPNTGLISYPLVTSDQVDSFLGRTALLSGKVTGVSSDYISLGRDGGELLKVHLPSKTSVLVGDSVSVPVIVDLNTSSGNIEAWALGEVDVLFRPIVIQDIPTNNTAEQSSPVATAVSRKSATKSVKLTPVSNSAPQSSAQTLAKTDLVSAPMSLEEAPVTQSEHSAASSKAANDVQRNVIMCLGSFVAGMITVRGRRFRKGVD